MEHTLCAADGVRLHWREWPCANARGSVFIVHGLGEHIGRYDALAAQLNGWHWHVAGHDQRGHGRSGGDRGALPRADALLADLALALDALRAAAPGPIVLLGHSLGGLIAARFVAEGRLPQRARWSRDVDALVLSSPALDPGMTRAQKLALALLGGLAPKLRVGNGLNPEWISRDPAVVRAYVADPLVHDRITPALARFIVDTGTVVREAASAWRVPTLLLYAGADRCVAPAGSAAFAATAPGAFVTAREFPAAYHEIFNEPDRDDALAVLRAWLEARH
jgi:alpha-beta hydrolase superfamily lysophospholipase